MTEILWKAGIIVKSPKKGDTTRCENWRPITFLHVASKVLPRAIFNRIIDEVEEILRPNQAGFRINESCTYQICILRILIEQSVEWHRLFEGVQYPKRKELWKIVNKYGLRDKFVSVVKLFSNGSMVKILHDGGLTEPINGVKQGCILSPNLFIIVMDWIMKEITKKKKTGIHWKTLMPLSWGTKTYLEKKTEQLSKERRKIEIKINMKKPKLMRITTQGEMAVSVESEELKVV